LTYHAALKQLRALDLHGLKQLGALTVRKTEVSEAGAKELRQALPGLKVVR
jgi:hypothetical protein